MSMEVNRDSTGRWQMEGEGAVFFADVPSDGLFTLRRGKSLGIRALPATPGAFAETLALRGARRMHQAAETDELSFDSESVIPFGVKTVLTKRYRMTPHVLQGALEFDLPHSFALERLSAGGIALFGSIREFGFAELPETAGALKERNVQEFNAVPDKTILYRGSLPLESVWISASDGSEMEFHTGESAWRWMNAPRLGGHAEYVLFRSGDELVYEWLLFAWDKPAPDPETGEVPLPPFGRTWRIGWDVNWTTPDQEKACPEAQYADVFDSINYKWPDSALISGPDGVPVQGRPCFSSPAVLNALKKWIRSNLASLKDGDVYAIRAAGGQICFSASHMQRARMGTLIHLTDPALMDFIRWANRQLAGKGGRCIVIRGE